METVRRYFIKIFKKFTENTIITDTYTDGYSPSTFHRELKNTYCMYMSLSPTRYFRRYISSENFFLASIFRL
jgi:hypothetical protein